MGSKENLRIQPSEHNLHHSHLEREMREARNNSTRLGSVAFRRVVDTQVKKVVDAVYDGRLNQANGSRFLSYLNSYKNSQGETALEVYRNAFDMRMINEATRQVLYNAGLNRDATRHFATQKVVPWIEEVLPCEVEVLVTNNGQVDGRSQQQEW